MAPVPVDMQFEVKGCRNWFKESALAHYCITKVARTT